MLWIRDCPLICRGSRIHPWYATENESTPGMLRITNPPLVCHGSRSSCSVVKLLVLEKISLGRNHRKKPGSQKTWRMGIPKKNIQKPKENQVFFGRNILQDFGDPDFFRWNWKKPKTKTESILWRPVVCGGERCYATENEFHPWYAPEHESTPGMLRITKPTPGMLRRTNPPLVC